MRPTVRGKHWVSVEARAILRHWRAATTRTGVAGALPLGVIVVLVLAFAIASDAFLSLRNLTAVSSQASTLLLACTGATFVVLMGSIDLSVGAIVLLVGAITVTLINAFDL